MSDSLTSVLLWWYFIRGDFELNNWIHMETEFLSCTWYVVISELNICRNVSDMYLDT